MDERLSAPVFDAARRHGLEEDEVRRQLARLTATPTSVQPDSPCTVGCGIRRLTAAERSEFAQLGAGLSPARALRFVPASGAASRMFKALLAKDEGAVAQLNARWSEFPFREGAEASGPCASAEDKWSAVIERLALHDLPKGALPFHTESQGVFTAFEAQLHEWAQTLSTPGGHLHFTLPVNGFDSLLETIEKQAQALHIQAEASIQHPSTDTLALDEDGQPFVLEDGTPLFRPGGHGALLRNLSDIAVSRPGTLVSVKNIDNVRPLRALDEVLPWRRALLGCAERLDRQRIAALHALGEGNTGPAQQWLRNGPLHPVEAPPSEATELVRALDRPLLVAGMVRNEGEPGGGPFWIRDDEGALRAQIVESAEMDIHNAGVRDCMGRATHFNPVDLVCAMHDAEGRPYDLSAFVDASRDFQVSKSHGGAPLKGLEHPGLWNGAMGRWNTVFIEVDAETFAPVKTVFDLLRPAHRA